MNNSVRDFVRTRAGGRCEYCRLPQNAVPSATFHVEHVIALQHGGSDEVSNLALSCDRCNVFKGTNLTSIDPIAGTLMPLFHPRQHLWSEHFVQSGYEIIGVTGIGRATVRLLNMNAPRRVSLRAATGFTAR